jgi:hypothetical protein
MTDTTQMAESRLEELHPGIGEVKTAVQSQRRKLIPVQQL